MNRVEGDNSCGMGVGWGGVGGEGEVGGGGGGRQGAEYRSGRGKKNDLSLTNTVVKKKK